MQSIHENDHSDDGGSSALNTPLFFLFLGLGLAGNYFRYDIFFNIEFLFGSIFAMLALQFFGMRRGVLAAGMISLVTYLSWNHPYAIIIMTCEALVVGLLGARRKLDLVTADAVYWLFVGIPLVFLFYYGIMHLPLYLAEVTMMKQAVNGIANALIARLLFVAMHSRAGTKQVTYQELLFHLLAFAVLTVSLFLLIHQTRHDFSETDQAIRGSLDLAKQRMSANLDGKLAADVSAIAYLARIAPRRSPQAMQQNIEQAHAMNDDFLRIGVLDRSATVTSFSPLIDDLGRPQLGRNYADRPFIPLLQRARKPMLTDVEMSRFGAPRPRAGVVAPVLNEGRYAGFAIGVLDLEHLREPLALNARAQIAQNLVFTLVDKHNKVIVTNRQDLKAMDPFARGEGELQRLDDRIAQWLPAQKKNISIAERWKHSSYVAEQPIGSGSEWKLIVELPIAPFQQKLLEKYAASLTEVFALLLVALAIARYLSRSAASSLEQLAHVASRIPSRLSSVESLMWPRSAIKEIRGLIHSFRDMAQVMAVQFQKIRSLNESLEQRINERTRELRESEERFRSLFEKVQVIALVIDPDDGTILDANSAATAYYGWSRDEMRSKNIAEINTLPPEDVLREIEAARSEQRSYFLFKHRRADGSVRDVEVYSGPVHAGGMAVLYSIVHDITGRRRAEASLRASEERFRFIYERSPLGMGFMAPDGTITDCNDMLVKIIGSPREKIVGFNLREGVSDPEMHHAVAEALSGRLGVYEGQYTTRTSGKSICMRTIYAPLIAGNGSVREILFLSEDITERKRAEALTKESHERLLTVLNGLDAIVYVADMQTYELLFVNKYVQAAFGDLVGQPCWKALQVGQSGPCAFCTNDKLLDAAGKPTGIHHWEFQNTANGRWYDIRDRALAWVDGRIVRMEIATDISERKRAEESVRRLANEQQTILNTVAIGVAFVKDRKLIWTNPAYERIFGYGPGEARGLDARLLYVNPEDYERVGREGYALINTGGVYTTEVLSARKDGCTFWLSLSGRAVNTSDIAEGSIWMMQDVTERKQAELELQDKTRQLEALTRDLESRVEHEVALRRSNEQMLVQQSKLAAMGEMLGAIAHQWRQPLNILGLIIQNLRDAHSFGELNKENIEHTVQKSMSQIRHMSKTIDDFRTFFQPDKERSAFDTMKAVGDVLSLFSAQLSANNIDFQLTCRTHHRTFTRVEDIVPCEEKIVTGFRNEFEHVIMNLINNAREAIVERRERGDMLEHERGRISFDFENTGGKILIEVGDNGGGIPEEVIGRVFEPYFTTKDPAKGTGLGLYMSTVIVKDHMQGRVTAKNSGQGAVFTIELPQAWERTGV